MAATWMDTHAAERIWSSCRSCLYQRSDGESGLQSVTAREALNENSTISRMGTYRNAKPSASIDLLK